MTKMRKKMLISSMAMLLIATLALSSASFAWFTAGDTAKIETMKFTTEASSGIQISTDAITWKSTLVAGAESGNDLTVDGSLIPCSSVGTVTSGVLALFKGTVEDTKLSASTASIATQSAGGYWSFDIYVNNAGATAQTLYLDIDSTTVSNSEEAPESGTDSRKRIENAVRIAFIDQGEGTDTSTATSVKTGTSAVIWEPNATAHDSWVTTNRYSVGSDGNIYTTSQESGKKYNNKVGSSSAEEYYVGIAGESNDIPYDGYAGTAYNNSGTTYSKVLKSGAVTTDKEGFGTAKDVDIINSSTGKIKIAELSANTITKLTIYVWIEGQDVDCNNAESGGKVNINFGFSTTGYQEPKQS